MKKRNSFKKQTLLSVLGIIITIICALAAILWETVGRETYLYKDVLVVSKDIDKGDIIDMNSLTYIKLEESKIISNPVLDPEIIISKAAKHFIPKNSQLMQDYFDDTKMVLNNDQFIFKVPAEWVVAVPSSIRRRDEVVFCEINTEFVEQVSAEATDNNSISSNTRIYSLVNEEWLKEFDIAKIDTKSDGKVQSPIFAATVAYVKDSNNREVINVGTNDRFDGSAQISSIEIIITLKELRAMELSLEKGNKFIILSREH